MYVQVQQLRAGSDLKQSLDISWMSAEELTDTGYVRCVTGASVPTDALVLRGTYQSDANWQGPAIWPCLTLFSVGVIPFWESYEERVQLEVTTLDAAVHPLDVPGETTNAVWLPFLVAAPFFAERFVQGDHGERPARSSAGCWRPACCPRRGESRGRQGGWRTDLETL